MEITLCDEDQKLVLSTDNIDNYNFVLVHLGEESIMVNVVELYSASLALLEHKKRDMEAQTELIKQESFYPIRER